MKGVMVVIAWVLIFLGLAIALPERSPGQLSPIPKPVPIQLKRVGPWVQVLQPGMREYWIRTKSITGMTYHDPTGPLADDTSRNPWTHIKVIVAGKDYRMDVLNQAEAKKFIEFILENEK